MGHDAYTRGVLVDENVVRTAVGTCIKDVAGPIYGYGERLYSRDNGSFKPGWERGVEKPVFDEVGWPGL